VSKKKKKNILPGKNAIVAKYLTDIIQDVITNELQKLGKK